jgi:outer membrane protein insertion porin family
MDDWIDYDLILRLKGRATYINRDQREKIPIAERLFMGGVRDVRGYVPYSISPYYEDAAGNRSLVGGTERASGSIEASIPLSEAAKMRLTFFYDYGYIAYDDDRFEGNLIVNDITRSSTGVVVEWQSGFGPINLVFGYPIDEQPGDQTAVFEFSMGSQF